MEKLIRWTVLVGVIACMVLALWAAAGLAQTTVPLESLRAVGNGRLLGIVDNRVVLVRLRGLSIVGDELQLLDPPRAPSMWALEAEGAPSASDNGYPAALMPQFPSHSS